MAEETEEMDLSEFDNAPGKAVSSDAPPVEDSGLKFELDEEPVPDTQVEQPQAPDSVPAEDIADLKARLDKLERENTSLRSATGRLGTELQQKDIQLKMFQQMQQQTGTPYQQTDEYADLDPDTRRYVDRKFQDMEQRNYWLNTMQQDMQFKVQNRITPEQEQFIEQYRALNQIGTFRDAYFSAKAQGFITDPVQPEPEKKPVRNVSVQPRVMPQQTGSTPRGSGSGGGGVNWSKLEQATNEQRTDYLRRVHEKGE